MNVDNYCVCCTCRQNKISDTLLSTFMMKLLNIKTATQPLTSNYTILTNTCTYLYRNLWVRNIVRDVNVVPTTSFVYDICLVGTYRKYRTNIVKCRILLVPLVLFDKGVINVRCSTWPPTNIYILRSSRFGAIHHVLRNVRDPIRISISGYFL